MRYAVLADIHGNLEALQTAIEYAHKQQLSHFLVLGDSIGYGANPNECLEWVLQNAEGHVLGNHEAAIIHEKIRWKFTDWARVAIDWTAEKLQPGFVAKIKDLPYLEIQNGLTLAHGTLHSPEQFGYLFTSEDAHRSFLAMETRIGFVGHSHVPCFFSEKGQEGRHLDPGIMKLQKGERYILNPGSIGQPRDHDKHLSLGIFDMVELTFEIVRLPYDNKRAAQKILDSGLPRSLADRL